MTYDPAKSWAEKNAAKNTRKWDPEKVIIYWVEARWVEHEREDDDYEDDEMRWDEFWLTKQSADNAVARIIDEKNLDEMFWFNVDIYITHPDTHNPDRRITTVNEKGVQQF